MLSLLPLLLSATLGSPAAADLATYALLDAPERHVRTTDRYVQRLLTTGVKRSPTLVSLITHLNASDVIVYVEAVQTLPTTLAGRLLLLPLTNQQRYLRIQITMSGTQDELIALIGHELRHAVEVADAPDVRNESGLVRLYKRIGVRNGTPHCYETEAAQTTARIVRRELLT